MIIVYCQMSNVFTYIMARTSYIQWNDDNLHFVQDKQFETLFELDFRRASPLKQQSACRHVAPLGHIILIPREETNTNFIMFSLTRPELEPTIYHTRGKHAKPLHHRCGSINIIKFDKYILILHRDQYCIKVYIWICNWITTHVYFFALTKMVDFPDMFCLFT